MNSHPSQISVEALGLFAALGLSLSSAKLAEAHEARKVIEVEVIKLACVRRTERDLEEMQQALEKFRNCVVQNGDNAAELDYEFHMLIFKAARNVVLMQMVNPFYVMTFQRRVAFFSEKSRGKISYDQHRALYECIKDQDVAKAKEVMESHIGRVQQLMQSE